MVLTLSVHEKKPDANMGTYFLRSLGQCVGVQNGQRWHKTRRHLEAHFSAPGAASLIADFQKTLKLWATKLRDQQLLHPIGSWLTVLQLVGSYPFV